MRGIAPQLGCNCVLGIAIIVAHRRQSLSSTDQAVSNLTPSASMEDERRELEIVSAALGNSSRLLRLITYIEKNLGRNGQTARVQHRNRSLRALK
jgi:cell division protein FtsL